MPGMRARNLRNHLAAAVAAMTWLAPGSIRAADLKPETLLRWEEYVKAVDARNQEHLEAGAAFLASDEIPEQAARLRAGEIVVIPAGTQVPVKVPSGLIHDWMGAIFIPNTTLAAILTLLRDYDHYKDFYHPNAVESKSIASPDSPGKCSSGQFSDRFSMILMNKSVVARTALDGDYRASYTQVNDFRWYSTTDTTRLQEIADFDTPSRHILPQNHGSGLIWRLHSVTRFEERDGGVYIEVEAVALSRDIPFALHWMIDPIVRRESRSSVATSLRQTEAAVRLNSAANIATADGVAAKAPVRSSR